MDENETDFENLKVENSKLEICGKDFVNITTVNPNIIQNYTNNHHCDYLLDINETDLEYLKVEKDFDNMTTVNPKIIQKYTNNHPSDYIVDKKETDFDKF